MLPESQYKPPSLLKDGFRFDVSFLVSRDLFGPEIGVCSRHRKVRRASVPITAVDEHRNLPSTEQQVSCATQITLWSCVDAVSKSLSVDEPAHGHFRSGIAAAVTLHGLARCRTGCP